MGYPKALLPIGKDTFLNRILGIGREVGLADPIVILGRAAKLIQPTMGNWPASIKINPDPDRGQLSSIQIGLSCLNEHAQACMIWPVDQPAVSADLVRRLVHLFIHSDCLIAFPTYRKRRGHPAIFHRSLFREFREIPLDEVPKKMILRHLQDTAEFSTDESAIVQDIDTPADYEALTGETLESALARTRLGTPPYFRPKP